jgi:hypothetical protein
MKRLDKVFNRFDWNTIVIKDSWEHKDLVAEVWAEYTGHLKPKHVCLGTLRDILRGAYNAWKAYKQRLPFPGWNYKIDNPIVTEKTKEIEAFNTKIEEAKTVCDVIDEQNNEGDRLFKLVEEAMGPPMQPEEEESSHLKVKGSSKPIDEINRVIDNVATFIKPNKKDKKNKKNKKKGRK